MPVRVIASEVEHKVPEGFYVYEPVVLPTATSTADAGVPSSTDRRKALLDRIRAKERANGTQGEVIHDVLPQRLASHRLM